MSECIFCAIVAGNAPADTVYEDDQVVAFRDINPRTKVHLVVIPKTHYATMDDLSAAEQSLAARLLYTARDLGRKHSPEHGYRIAIHAGGQQDIDHLHLNVFGGHSQLGRPAEGVSS